MRALEPVPELQSVQVRVPGAGDMAAYKAELSAQRTRPAAPLQHYIFGFADRLARYGSGLRPFDQCDADGTGDEVR